MARIRSVHPGQWTDGDFLECSPLARLLCLAIRNVADDHGVFRWKPTSIKAECLPGDNCEISDLLNELVLHEQIQRYEIEGKEYGIVVDFCQWQRPRKPSYIHPTPPNFGTSAVPVPNQCRTGGGISPQRKEVGGINKKGDEKKLSVEWSQGSPKAQQSPMSIYSQTEIERLCVLHDLIADVEKEILGILKWCDSKDMTDDNRRKRIVLQKLQERQEQLAATKALKSTEAVPVSPEAFSALVRKATAQ
jgi:hypothetical protein